MRKFAAALALALLLPLSAVAQTKIVTLGTSLQLTGPSANLGRYFRDGYQIAVDRINELGGIDIGGTRYRLALKVFDNQSDINLGVQQYVQLVNRDRVDFLLGPYSSNDTLVDSTVAEKYEIPMVESGGAAAQIFDRGYKNVFGLAPPAGDYFSSTLDMMSKLDPKPQTLGLLVADDAFDVSVGDGVRAQAPKYGIAVSLDRQYSEGNPNLSPLLALIKAKLPDAVLLGGHETEALNFIREAKSLDANPAGLLALTVGVPSADFRAALGKDAEYAFGMTPWIASPVAHDRWFGDGQQFAALFRQRFGYEADYHIASALAAVETFATAFETAGSLDRDKVRDAIAKSNFESLYAPISFGPTGQIDIPQIVIQVQDGKVVPIFTDHFLNKPRYPVPAWGKRG